MPVGGEFVVRAIDAVRDFVKETEAAEHVLEEVSDAEQAISDADEAVQEADDTAASGADDAGGGSDDAGGSSDSPESSSESDGGDSCSLNSFAGSTQVLMADGATKAIDQIKVGDKVSNADPDSSTVQQHTVTAVHATYTDHDFDDLTVSTPNGSETITVTAAHLVWDVTTQQWTEAGDLRIGDQFDAPGDARATVAASRHYTESITTYNFSIDDVHTYYITTGATPSLAHNCGPVETVSRCCVVRALRRRAIYGHPPADRSVGSKPHRVCGWSP